jgi:NAD(P)-dependent dehydrogenase (short-subunit alcohol dehydrogenase family)
MPRALAEQILVITGASAGIGREAALRLGRHGALIEEPPSL